MINDVRSKRMILSVSEETLKVKGINQEMGESVEEIDIKYSGEDNSVAYNYSYIQDVIKQIDSEIVTFMVNKDSSPRDRKRRLLFYNYAYEFRRRIIK